MKINYYSRTICKCKEKLYVLILKNKKVYNKCQV